MHDRLYPRSTPFHLAISAPRHRAKGGGDAGRGRYLGVGAEQVLVAAPPEHERLIAAPLEGGTGMFPGPAVHQGRGFLLILLEDPDTEGLMRTEILALVMAGGEGSRLFPLTAERSKPSVPFGGRYRLVDFVLSNLVNSGVHAIYSFSVN